MVTQEGFEYPLIKFAVMTETDIFGKEQKKEKKKEKVQRKRIQDFAELSSVILLFMKSMDWEFTVESKKLRLIRLSKIISRLNTRGGSNLYIPGNTAG